MTSFLPAEHVAMTRALHLARQAAEQGEVPVGAVMIMGDQIVGEGHNQRERNHDPVGHAEILAIRAASTALGRWRLTNCTLVVTLEPCVMCAGAIVNARVDKLVFGATDPRYGAVGSIFDMVRHPQLNHRATVSDGLLAAESSDLLRAFFASRRASSRRSTAKAPGDGP